MKTKPTYQELEKELETLRLTKNIIERSPAVAFLWKNQDNWPVEFVSKNVENIFGYTADEFMKGEIVYRKIIHPDDLPGVTDEVKTNSENNSVSFTHKPYRIICKSGEIKYINDTTYIRRDKNGKITHYDGIILDITESKNADKEIKKLSKAIEQSSNTIVITDTEGNIEYTNPKFTELTGYTAEEALGQNPRILNTGIQTKEYYTQMWKTIKEGKTWKGEFSNKTKAGKHFWEQVTITPIKDDKGKIINFLAIKEDFTARRNAEQEIQKQNKQLKKLNATKDKFFSIIAHDLKSPFNSLVGYSDLLSENFDDFDSETQKKYIGFIKEGVINTHKLLENLLLWSQSQKGVIKFKPDLHNLHLVTKETLKYSEQPATAKSISITNEIPENVFVKADKDMLAIILRNLISNAIKFNPKGGEIVINASSFMNEDKQNFIKISVKDTGVGISSEIQAKLFKIEGDISSSGTENESGTGLGLILCKEFIEKHGGKIWLKSKLKKGSTFIFTLPLSMNN